MALINVSALKKNAFPLTVLIISVLLIASVLVLTCLRTEFSDPKTPTKFVDFDSSTLQQNYYLSKEISYSLRYADNFGLIESIRAYSDDSSFGRTYTFEFTLKGGEKTLSAVAVTNDYEKLPKKFQAQSVENGYFSFLIETDGAEYNAMPSFSYFSDIAYIIRKAFDRSDSQPVKDLIWKRGNDAIAKELQSSARSEDDPYSMLTGSGKEAIKQSLEKINAVSK